MIVGQSFSIGLFHFQVIKDVTSHIRRKSTGNLNENGGKRSV